MNYRAMVQEYFPEATEEEAGHILWELTPFPLVGGEELRACLEQVRQERLEAATPDEVRA